MEKVRAGLARKFQTDFSGHCLKRKFQSTEFSGKCIAWEDQKHYHWDVQVVPVDRRFRCSHELFTFFRVGLRCRIVSDTRVS